MQIRMEMSSEALLLPLSSASMQPWERAAANQLNGNIPFENLAGFASTSGGCYVSGNTVLTPPAPTTVRQCRAQYIRGPGFHDWDFSVSKIWKLNERVAVQFRGEVFNILNHPSFGVFSLNNDVSDPTSVGTPAFTPDLGSASNPVLGTGGPRHIQLGLKVLW